MTRRRRSLTLLRRWHHHFRHGDTKKLETVCRLSRLHEPQNTFLTLDHLSDRLDLLPSHPNTQMSWTIEKPKLIVVYWHRATPTALSHPAKIYSVGANLYVWPIEEDDRANVSVRLEDCSGEWAALSFHRYSRNTCPLPATA
jgi:hypothetical protein